MIVLCYNTTPLREGVYVNNDFNVEIKKLEENKRIKNKLMFLSLYYEFYNSTVSILSMYNESVSTVYGRFLTSNLEQKLDEVALETMSDNHVMMFNNFVSSAEKHGLSSILPVREYIAFYKNNLDDFVSGMQYVSFIDSLDIDFVSKVKMVIIFRNHIQGICSSFSALSDKNKNLEKLGQIKYELINALPNILADNNGVEDFDLMLQQVTEKLFFPKINDSMVDFDSLKEKGRFLSLNEVEKRIYAYDKTFALAGYNPESTGIKKETDEKKAKMLKFMKKKAERN